MDYANFLIEKIIYYFLTTKCVQILQKKLFLKIKFFKNIQKTSIGGIISF